MYLSVEVQNSISVTKKERHPRRRRRNQKRRLGRSTIETEESIILLGVSKIQGEM